MDCGSRFFYALEKERGAKKHVTCLLAEDSSPLTDMAEMCGRARACYANLFSLDPTDADACRVLWNELPMVSVGDWDWLELPLTLAKFSEVLCLMPSNKSQGTDGLTVEFYRVFWDVLGPDPVTIWAKSLGNGVLPLSCSHSKGHLTVAWDVVHPDQTYTVPGRSIFNNLYLVWDLLKLGYSDGLLFAFLSLDQEKAFNRVDHGYLLGTLQAFNFGPQFACFLQRLTGLVLRELELWLVLLAYADNMLLVVQNPGNLVWVEACQAIYLVASSTWVNWVKSSGLMVGR
ncbi:unnamed protein product [Caretta caretta]